MNFLYLQRGDANAAETEYILNDWALKVTKALLTRKYDWKRTDFQFISATLQNLLAFLTEHARCGDSEVSTILYS